jgi:chromosome segregation ATPase
VAVTPERLQEIAAKIRSDVAGGHLGDPRYGVVISSDKLDALTAAIPALLTQVSDLEQRLSIATETNVSDRQLIAALEARQQELLALTVRLTNETPFPEEVKGWTAQRAAMIAEIGTERARVGEIEAERDGLTTRLRALETRIAGIAALLAADPVQDVDADLAAIGAAVSRRDEVEASLKRMSQGAKSDDRQITELEAELAKLRPVYVAARTWRAADRLYTDERTGLAAHATLTDLAGAVDAAEPTS